MLRRFKIICTGIGGEEVIRKLRDRMQSLIVGDPMDKNTDIGAINSKEQLHIIQKYIAIGKKEGAGNV